MKNLEIMKKNNFSFNWSVRPLSQMTLHLTNPLPRLIHISFLLDCRGREKCHMSSTFRNGYCMRNCMLINNFTYLRGRHAYPDDRIDLVTVLARPFIKITCSSSNHSQFN